MSDYPKLYSSSDAAARAAANHARIMRALPTRVTPFLRVSGDGATLVFEYVDGAAPRGGNQLVQAAAVAGALHAGWIRECVTASTSSSPFSRVRRSLFERRLAHLGNAYPFRGVAWDAWWRSADECAVGVYKDCNVSNFMARDEGIWLVDFDTVTPAPAGYDHAKLILTAAIRDGALPPIQAMIEAWRNAARPYHYGFNGLTLAFYLEMHWVLTHPFCRKNGYTTPWPRLRDEALVAIADL